jgi:hypothetical protein
MANAPKRVDLRSTRLEITEQNSRLNQAAKEEYANTYREKRLKTPRNIKGYFSKKGNN